MTNLQRTKQAYAEIDAFIEILPEDKKRKIPKNMKEFFKEQKDKGYKKEIDINIPVEEQNLKEETLALIALLYIKYICEDEEEKQNLKKIYAENESRYRKEKNEKYSEEKIMQKRNEDLASECDQSLQNSINNKSKALIEYKEPILKRIMNKIKSLFKRK
jgi:hypothetical protein